MIHIRVEDQKKRMEINKKNHHRPRLLIALIHISYVELPAITSRSLYSCSNRNAKEVNLDVREWFEIRLGTAMNFHFKNVQKATNCCMLGYFFGSDWWLSSRKGVYWAIVLTVESTLRPPWQLARQHRADRRQVHVLNVDRTDGEGEE